MKKEIVLKVIGTQRIDDQKDTIELTTIGFIDEDEEAYTVHYTEEQEPPMSAVNAVVRICKDDSLVEMIRTGAYDSCLIIEKSKRNSCQYGTQFGDLLMGIYGKSIESDISDGEGTFFFGYDIDVNGALASRNEVKMIIRSNNRCPKS